MKKYPECFLKASVVVTFLLSTITFSEEHQFVRAYFTSRDMAHQARELYEAEALEVFWEDGYVVLMDLEEKDIALLKDLDFVVRYLFNHKYDGDIVRCYTQFCT